MRPMGPPHVPKTPTCPLSPPIGFPCPFRPICPIGPHMPYRNSMDPIKPLCAL